MADEPEEVDGEAEGEDAAEGAPKSKKKKKLIMLGGAVLVLLLAGGGAFFFLMGGDPEPEMAAAEMPAPDGGDAATAEALNAVFYSLPSVLVNLSTESSRNTYLRVAATLELPNPADEAVAREKASAIMDGFQTFLREMRPSDIAGSGGLLLLKEELLVRANTAIGHNAVQNVLLTEFLVQ